MDNQKQTSSEIKVTWKGWLSFVIFLLLFSGALPEIAKSSPSLGWLKAFDFSSMVGKFGTDLVGGKNNPAGARWGFMEALVLFPTVILAMGVIEVLEAKGALDAAGKIFQPLFKPLMGIPGICALAFGAGMSSSDVGSVMTRQLREEDKLTEKERTIFAIYQYPGSGTIANVFGPGGPLLAISLFAPGIIILVILLMKVTAANMARFYLNYREKKGMEI